MIGLITFLSFATFFGLIAWAEIYFRKLSKEQIITGLKTTGLTLLIIVGVWIFCGTLGNIVLALVCWVVVVFLLSLGRYFRKKKN